MSAAVVPSASQLTVLAIQTGAACFGAGIIWTMQVLNYPLLALVGADQIPAYEGAHNRRFIRVVGPAVVGVAASAVAMLFVRPSDVSVAVPAVELGLLGVIIVSTAAYGAPAHARLQRGFDAAVLARLVRTNWVRTAAWTVLGAVDLVTLAKVARR